MIVFKAGLVLLIIGILLLLISLAIKGSNKLYGYCIVGSVYAICLATFMIFFGYILGMITGAIPVIKVL